MLYVIKGDEEEIEKTVEFSLGMYGENVALYANLRGNPHTYRLLFITPDGNIYKSGYVSTEFGLNLDEFRRVVLEEDPRE